MNKEFFLKCDCQEDGLSFVTYDWYDNDPGIGGDYLWQQVQTNFSNSSSNVQIFCLGTTDEYFVQLSSNVGYSFLLLKYVPEENQTKEFWQNLGSKVAQMHNAETSEFLSKEDLDKENKFGFSRDNYIGRNKQINSAKKTWIDFFRENRLEVQFKLAQNYFSENAASSYADP